MTDFANVNQFLKAFHDSVHQGPSVHGGPYQFKITLSAGSIMDSNVTPDTVKERIKMVFDEAKEDLQKGTRNSVFLYFSGHGYKNMLIFKDAGLKYT